MAVAASLKIEIPLDGFTTTAKPPEELAVRQRLEAGASGSKSPEDYVKAEQTATLLHKAHIEAVKERAHRDTQRAREAQARRLRLEANAHQRVQDRVDAVAARAARLSDLKKAQLSERQAQREALQARAKGAREAHEESMKARATMELDRCVEASLKRKKALAAIVDKSRLVVKQALARAASVKELEREAAAASGEKLSLKLLQADERRLEMASPREEGLERAAERARQVAALQRALDLKTEEKRLHLSRTLERAGEKRDSHVQSIAARAGASNARAAQAAAEIRELAETNERLARRSLFEKLNQAEIRAKLHQPAQRASATKPGVLIEVAVHPEPQPAAPAALVARLSAAPAHTADLESFAALAKSRLVAAAERAVAHAAARGRKAALSSERVAGAAVRRSSAALSLVATTERRLVAAARLQAAARLARLTFARKTSARASAAALRRSSRAVSVKLALQRSSLQADAATGRWATALLGAPALGRTAAAARERRLIAGSAKASVLRNRAKHIPTPPAAAEGWAVVDAPAREE